MVTVTLESTDKGRPLYDQAPPDDTPTRGNTNTPATAALFTSGFTTWLRLPSKAHGNANDPGDHGRSFAQSNARSEIWSAVRR